MLVSRIGAGLVKSGYQNTLEMLLWESGVLIREGL